MRKLLVTSTILSSLVFAQNDGLVKTYYPNKALETEGNYSNGVRDGLWVFWYEGEVFQDYGEDTEPNTNDPGENNGIWDSTETVILDLDGDTFYDPPLKKSEGSYSNGNREGLWTTWYLNNMRKEESNFTQGKLDGVIIRWFENGNKSEEGTYSSGKQSGRWIWYFETGIKKEQTQFTDGQQNGLWLQWFKDGAKKI
jgi:antitoxin component YwqK of YwqJK toxin-antitoxin module